MISYAQNAEDVVVSDGFYVDVGAWDPLVDSVTKIFYDAGWSGLNLEPQPRRLAPFYAQRPRDINLALAASDVVGMATLLVAQYSPLSTLHQSVIDSSNTDYAIVDRIETRTMPLAKILDEHARDRIIHFLKIDVEGDEAAVLRGADFNRYRPMALVIEATCPTTNAPRWPAWEKLVLDAGYQFALFDGLNRFYVCDERSDLLSKLCCGANCLDGYITYRESQLRARLHAAEEEIRRVCQVLAAAPGKALPP